MSYFYKSALAWIGSCILVIGILAGLSWANYRLVQHYSGGADLLVQWTGTRTFLLEGLDPYNQNSENKIETLIYGHTARAGEPPLRYVSPLYTILFYVPLLILNDFNLVRALWMTIMEVALLFAMVFSIQMADWKPGPIVLGLLLLFSLFGYYSWQPLVDGDEIILAALFITAGLWAIGTKADELAGVLFAFATIKPQATFLILLFVLVWGVRQQRWRLIAWMLGTLFCLCAAISLLKPDWILMDLRAVVQFLKENPVGFLGDVLAVILPGMGQRLGWILSAVLLIVLALEWWLAHQREYRSFLWTACLTLAISQWLGIRINPDRLVLLFPVVILICTLLSERWKRAGMAFVFVTVFLLIAVSWVIYFYLAGDYSRLSAVMMFPMPVFLFVMLYWVRWWAVRPSNLWFDTIISKGNPESR